jgi:RNA polymerase sigma factor, sigma-70 family
LDRHTFEEEIRKITKLLYHISWSMLSDNEDCADAVQEALMKAWQTRSALRKRSAFKAWMAQIQYNVCRDMVRKRQKQAYVPLAPEHAAAMTTSMSELSFGELLQQLSPDHRAVVILHYLEGYRVEEIADMTECPVGTVKTRLMHARAHLKKTLGSDVDVTGGVSYERQ